MLFPMREALMDFNLVQSEETWMLGSQPAAQQQMSLSGHKVKTAAPRFKTA